MPLFKNANTFLTHTVGRLFKEFIESEKISGFILIGCTILSIAIANSSFGNDYIHFWHTNIGSHTIEFWINDLLMAVFFLLVGLEIERELYVGELSSFKNSLLPIFAAIGGMLIPAAIHFSLNNGLNTASGAGIPMATDIAFALGILAILGRRVPLQLKIFLTALAIIDDLGAIATIAVFYTQTMSLIYLFLAIFIFFLLLALNKLKVTNIYLYLCLGLVMWYFMSQSGIHATISGVMLAFTIPFGKGDAHSPSLRLQHQLHKPVAYFILPLFALANTCIIFQDNWQTSLLSANSLGIAAGLIIGKPIGIILFSYLIIKLGYSKLPNGVSWSQLTGAGILGGIGFTMSIFISILAFNNQTDVENSKIAVLIASGIASVIGLVFLGSIPFKSFNNNDIKKT